MLWLTRLAVSRRPTHWAAKGGFCAIGRFHLRLHAGQFGRVLHRILHRFSEVVLGHLQVVLGRDGLGVADPGTNNLHRERLGKFCLASAAKVLE
jgi:hypothetical protein